MGGMPGNIGKGPIFQRLKAFSKDTDRKSEFEQARADLDDPSNDLVFLDKKYGVVKPSKGTSRASIFATSGSSPGGRSTSRSSQ